MEVEEARNSLLMRCQHCLPPFSHFCPLASWNTKVLLWLSKGVRDIDLNSLTWLFPCDSYSPPIGPPVPPFLSGRYITHPFYLYVRLEQSWKPAQSTHRVTPYSKYETGKQEENHVSTVTV